MFSLVEGLQMASAKKNKIIILIIIIVLHFPSQGLMFGYATDETEECIPLTILLAHKLNYKLKELSVNGDCPWILPDSKSQVSYCCNQIKFNFIGSLNIKCNPRCFQKLKVNGWMQIFLHFVLHRHNHYRSLTSNEVLNIFHFSCTDSLE